MNEEGDVSAFIDVSADGMPGIQPHIFTESSVDLRAAMSPDGTENQAPISAADDLTTVTRKLDETSISSTVISDERPTSQANNLNGCLYASVRDPTSPELKGKYLKKWTEESNPSAKENSRSEEGKRYVIVNWGLKRVIRGGPYPLRVRREAITQGREQRNCEVHGDTDVGGSFIRYLFDETATDEDVKAFAERLHLLLVTEVYQCGAVGGDAINTYYACGSLTNTGWFSWEAPPSPNAAVVAGAGPGTDAAAEAGELGETEVGEEEAAVAEAAEAEVEVEVEAETIDSPPTSFHAPATP
ncbi:hypothetical protein B484DRAFT_458736 [Ochromonadaceae sp. CCMP2298]|nr:hypothetical protein B484DRAFT_458736 [Ochromonadaceae sp. CCMP2298]|mmetsp:Transcript_11857/g.26346  ORF Transcript_11857/g.26346 Transcript_11857/m.26346 type:complete len:300 (+) Transcript_11857:145-1044(+)